MRIFELSTHVKSISRSDGRSATAAAAYRACCVIECEREGKTHDYTRKKGLEASRNRRARGRARMGADARLWNAAELRERNGKRGPRGRAVQGQRASRPRTDVQLSGRAVAGGASSGPRGSLPGTWPTPTRLGADFSIHRPGKDGDQRNFHCHMMMTTRRLTAKGLGAKTREWDDLKTRSVLAKGFPRLRGGDFERRPCRRRQGRRSSMSNTAVSRRAAAARSPTRHQGVARTNAERARKRTTRAAWERAARNDQHERHAKERAALKVQQDFALAAKVGDLAERERKGIAAIRARLARRRRRTQRRRA